MAFLYSDVNTGVFYRLGKLIKKLNSYLTLASTTLPADEKEIVDPYELADMPDQVQGIYALYPSAQQQIVQLRQALAAAADVTLQDRASVIVQLGLTQSDLNSILPALHTQMIADSQTLDRSTVTVGVVVKNSGNIGTGWILPTKVLDGVSAPTKNGRAFQKYNGLASELTVPSETQTFECTSDSGSSGAVEGGEGFFWKGKIEDQAQGFLGEGSGDGPTITVANANGIITDGALESWTANAPDNWPIDNGLAGTHIFQELTIIHRGLSSLKFLGTGAQAVMGIGQDQSVSSYKPRQRLAVGLWVYGDSIPAAGSLNMKFTGTGYSASSPTNTVVTATISGTPAGGSYTLGFKLPYGNADPVVSTAIAYNESAATIRTILRAIPGLGHVHVTQSGSSPNVVNTITFYGLPGDIPTPTLATNSMTGGTSPTVALATTVHGVEGEQIILPANGFPNNSSGVGWHLLYFWINLPNIVPSDWKLILQITGTLSNAVALYADSLFVKEVDYHGGIGGVAVAGSVPFVLSDKFQLAVSNDAAGTFQEFFRSHYNFQLPSDGTGSETILDSLAS